jgi:hypothetical protein
MKTKNKIILIIFVFAIVATIIILNFNFIEQFNILDYQFSQENTPLYKPSNTEGLTPFEKYFSVNITDRGPWEQSKNLEQKGVQEATTEIQVQVPGEDRTVTQNIVIRRPSEYIEKPKTNVVFIDSYQKKKFPTIIDYQFSEFNFPSFPINSMKVTPHRPWTDTKQVDKYIIPQTITPFATNLYEVYYK